MTNVLDWILDLFRDPVQAQAFLNDPDKSMQNAGVQNVSAAQVNAVAASVAPAAVINGGGDPVHGLQQAVAQTHGIAFTPQYAPVWAPETQAFSNNDTLSHNDVLSNNDPHFLSPEAGH
ncbi:MAG TPA: IniB N-terminal domain-containing protein, partial [Mycobacterium sp.]|nr:IniB N-terminal domain-containing protein [Mycobacterium sp.]